MFDEYLYKDMSSKIEIKLHREDEQLMSSWEISNFIYQFSSYYYKEELLNTISLALNNGIDPSNIFVLGKSFDIDNSYSKVGVLKLDNTNDLKTLYHLGSLTSMFPNKKVFYINLIFQLFRSINETIYSNCSARMSKDNLGIYISKLNELNIERTLNIISNDAIQFVSSCDIDQIDQNEQLLNSKIFNCNEVIKKKLKQALKNLKKYDEDALYFNSVEDLLEETISEDSDVNLYEEIKNKYFDKFYKDLIKLSRPIVGIFYEEDNMTQILCSSHINRKKRDTRFLDFKEIKHNSPLTMIIVGGLAMGIPAMAMVKIAILKFKEKNLNKSISKKEEELKILREQTYINLSKIMTNQETEAIDKINDRFIRNNLRVIKTVNSKKSIEYAEGYGFNPEKAEINIAKEEEISSTEIKEEEPKFMEH